MGETKIRINYEVELDTTGCGWSDLVKAINKELSEREIDTLDESYELISGDVDVNGEFIDIYAKINKKEMKIGLIVNTASRKE